MTDFLRDESAPAFMEYGLLVIVIALIVLLAATTFGGVVAQMFQDGANAN